MFVWLLAAAVARLFYKPARQGRKVAYLTVASFIFLVIAAGVGLFLNTQHGGKEQSRREAERSTRSRRWPWTLVIAVCRVGRSPTNAASRSWSDCVLTLTLAPPPVSSPGGSA